MIMYQVFIRLRIESLQVQWEVYGMVGNRLKLIRQANALSLQELSELLVGSDLPIKRAALSHYELGITDPSPAALEILARKLGTTPGFFKKPDWADIRFTLFMPLEIPSKYETALFSYLQIELEKMLHIEKLLQVKQPFPLPEKVSIRAGQDFLAEELAEKMRQTYGLGRMPISSVCTMLESNGWHIIELPETFGPLCVSGYEHSQELGFILHQPLYVIDDFRMSLLKTVGYACLVGETPQHTDQLTDRFSRAMLFPRDLVCMEFGPPRAEVSIAELTFMKQKYGISKRAIMRRLEELGLISRAYYDSFEDLMRLHGFPRRKKIMSETLNFYENPTLPSMRILEAQARGLLTQEGVDELLLLKNMW